MSEAGDTPSQVRVVKRNLFTECWYNQHVGQVFNVLRTQNRADGHLQYVVDIRHLNRSTTDGSYEGVYEGFIAGFIDESDTEIEG
jgi:hypothetical protein